MIRKWTRPLPYERRREVLEQLSQASSPNFDFFVLVVLSTSIATLGLMVDSPAVVIGAMLVAPLMSPILGLSLASVTAEQTVFRQALVALIRGVLLSIALSAALSLVAQSLPFYAMNGLPEEVAARTHPPPFDLGIALAGGAAAAYALAQPQLSAALPGVAIATALVPPLCTVGIGLSMRDPEVALGALLLFVTNLVAISFAGLLVFVALGFRPTWPERENGSVRKNVLLSAALVLAVTIPLVAIALNFVREARQEQARQDLEREVRQAVEMEVAGMVSAQLVAVEIVSADDGATATPGGIQVVAVVGSPGGSGSELGSGPDLESGLSLIVTVRTPRTLTYQEVVALQTALAERLQRAVALELIGVPMIRLDPRLPPTHTPTPTPGPSASPTPSPTPTRTPAPPTATASPTLSPTATPTLTPSATPTPVTAFIETVKGAGAFLRETPGGAVLATLAEGAAVQLLPGREIANGSEWLRVRDGHGREGWVQARYLIVRP